MNVKGLRWFIPVLVLAIFASSCASTSKASESKSDEAKTFEAPGDKGTVFLYRTGRAVGATGQLSVKVNSMAAGGTGLLHQAGCQTGY